MTSVDDVIAKIEKHGPGWLSTVSNKPGESNESLRELVNELIAAIRRERQEAPADVPPPGYRWATEEETERWTLGDDEIMSRAIVVPLSTDSTGRPYTEGEADLAVPTRSEQ